MMPKNHFSQFERNLGKPSTDFYPSRGPGVRGYDTTHDFTSFSPTRSRNYDDPLERKVGHPLTIVPASYICNRCKGRGHFVGDCPTNEDPEYDMPAGFDYICKYCGERGTHYYMFCDRNPDPNSVYRRRQAKGLAVSSPSRADRTSERSYSPPREFAGPPIPSRSLRRLYDDRRSSVGEVQGFGTFTRVKKITSRAGFSGEREDNDVDRIQISIKRAGGENARFKRTAEDDDLITGGLKEEQKYKSFSFMDIKAMRECPELLKIDRFDSHLGRQNSKLSEGDMVWERLKNDMEREYLKRPQQQSRTSEEQIISRKTAKLNLSPASDVESNKSSNAKILKELFENHPSQPGPERRARVTALDMWDISDEKKCQEDAGMEENVEVAEVEDNTENVEVAEVEDNAEMVEMADREENANIDEIPVVDKMPDTDEIPDTDEMPDTNEMANMDAMSSPAESVIEVGRATLNRKRKNVDEIDWADKDVDASDEEPAQMSKRSRVIDNSDRNQEPDEDEEQQEEPPSAKKMAAIRKKINSLDGLRTRLAAWGDISSPEMEAMASGDLSQTKLDEISERVQHYD